MEARITTQPLDGARPSSAAIRLANAAASPGELDLANPDVAEPLLCAFGRILEARFPLAALGVTAGQGLRFQLSLWQGGLPVDAVPQQGWLEMRSTSPAEMAG